MSEIKSENKEEKITPHNIHEAKAKKAYFLRPYMSGFDFDEYRGRQDEILAERIKDEKGSNTRWEYRKLNDILSNKEGEVYSEEILKKLEYGKEGCKYEEKKYSGFNI